VALCILIFEQFDLHPPLLHVTGHLVGRLISQFLLNFEVQDVFEPLEQPGYSFGLLSGKYNA
jgi:hypothetical protein